MHSFIDNMTITKCHWHQWDVLCYCTTNQKSERDGVTVQLLDFTLQQQEITTDASKYGSKIQEASES